MQLTDMRSGTMQVRGRIRQMQEDASYLRKAERKLAASLAEAERDPALSGSLEAESSEGWIMSQQCPPVNWPSIEDHER